MNNPIIICPYLDYNSITALKAAIHYTIPVHFWHDTGRIGSDLAYQYLWNLHKDRDVIILHTDMLPLPHDTSSLWYAMLLEQVKQGATQAVNIESQLILISLSDSAIITLK